MERKTITLSQEMEKNWAIFTAPNGVYVKKEVRPALKGYTQGLESVWRMFDAGKISVRQACAILAGTYHLGTKTLEKE